MVGGLEACRRVAAVAVLAVSSIVPLGGPARTVAAPAPVADVVTSCSVTVGTATTDPALAADAARALTAGYAVTDCMPDASLLAAAEARAAIPLPGAAGDSGPVVGSAGVGGAAVGGAVVGGAVADTSGGIGGAGHGDRGLGAHHVHGADDERGADHAERRGDDDGHPEQHGDDHDAGDELGDLRHGEQHGGRRHEQ